ncbi:MAG: SDR family oxidoreductase [Salinivirgaceae bacterium]|nr:SDR family oxidoreductase [Salinivirgaceae bacterium]
MNLKNKIVLVTGGASGIGLGIAKTFILQGCKVAITDIDQLKGKQFAQSYPEALFIKADMSEEDDILAVFQKIDAKFDVPDILVNNVGISRFKPLLEITTNEWDKILNTNLRSAFICSREFARRHPGNRYGRIINISSTRHLMSEPNGEAYAASKGGLVSLTHALAASLQSQGMTVNCISPGWIHNGNPAELNTSDHIQHFAKRVGVAEDIARMCLFLCQPENDFITGQNFYIDGGMTKKMIYEEEN